MHITLYLSIQGFGHIEMLRKRDELREKIISSPLINGKTAKPTVS